MEKNESLLKLGIILLIITGTAGLILGIVHTITKEPIAKQIEKTNNEAMQEIIPNADNFKNINIKTTDMIKEVNEAKNGNDIVGYAIKVSPKGYGGLIEMMVGISKDGEVQGIKILSLSETPGLGANAKQPEFSKQFKDKKTNAPLQVVKRDPSDSNEIQAITGATITSEAVTSGVNEAIEFYNNQLKGGQK